MRVRLRRMGILGRLNIEVITVSLGYTNSSRADSNLVLNHQGS